MLVLLSIGLMPLTSGAAPPGTYSGKAGALAFGLDLLFADPAAPEGITAGVSTAEANSTPYGTGKGAGTCDAVPAGITPIALPCTGSENLVQATASTPGQSDDPAELCDETVPAEIASFLNIEGACGDARANITGVDPLGEGEGAVSTATVTFDLSSIPGIGGDIEETKDMIVETIEDLVDTADPPEELAAILETLFGTLTGRQSLLGANLGATKSTVFTSGNTLTSQAVAEGGVLGILPIPVCTLDGTQQPPAVECPATRGFPPTLYGLIIIELAKTSSEAKWDATPNGAGATATAQPVVATIFIRDLTKPLELSYIEVPVSPGSPPIPNPLFGGTALQTSITLVGSTAESFNEPAPAKKGNARAASGFLEIHALQGVGGTMDNEAECQIANCDGGIRLRIASTEAIALGEVPQSQQVQALPITGGERFVFFAVALVLGLAAPLLYRKSRRLRNSA